MRSIVTDPNIPYLTPSKWAFLLSGRKRTSFDRHSRKTKLSRVFPSFHVCGRIARQIKTVPRFAEVCRLRTEKVKELGDFFRHTSARRCDQPEIPAGQRRNRHRDDQFRHDEGRENSKRCLATLCVLTAGSFLRGLVFLTFSVALGLSFWKMEQDWYLGTLAAFSFWIVLVGGSGRNIWRALPAARSYNGGRTSGPRFAIAWRLSLLP